MGAALTGKGPLTVFAPTDAAFKLADLTPANVCTALPKATLTKILLYHVVKGSVLADKALPAGPRKINTITTLLGQPVWSLYNGYLFTTSGSVRAHHGQSRTLQQSWPRTASSTSSTGSSSPPLNRDQLRCGRGRIVDRNAAEAGPVGPASAIETGQDGSLLARRGPTGF